MYITNDIRYIGVNDHTVDLFEGQYLVPKGIAYNSYVILDEKIAVMDTVDQNFTQPWLENLSAALEGREPDYLIVQHMEPDHAANVDKFLALYPSAIVVASAKAFAMMKGFFGTDYAERRIIVGEGSTLSLGRHTLTFVTAPWSTGPRSSSPTIPMTRSSSPPTASASSEPWTWRSPGRTRPGGTTSASWASTVPRSRPC